MSFSLIERDLKHIWHPCSQMKDYESFKPALIKRAQGSFIELTDGSKLIDATSSWWCKTLGHSHPRLLAALLEQSESFEHVIFANTTHTKIVKLSEKLCALTDSLNKVFYAGDGSCAVEIALKMSIHSRQITGNTERRHFIALKNAYHGETLGTLSVSDLGIYKDAYQPLLFDSFFIENIPYVTSKNDPTWKDCSEYWPRIEAQLAPYADTTTALIVEPILQAAGGMKIYSQDLLKRLRNWCRYNDVHLIADEIMTGLGRTGKMLACDYANIEADFLCLGKGLTAGCLPFSAVLTSDAIYEKFYDDYENGKSFLHSHTYSGNALAASIALETLTIIEEENICAQANQIGEYMLTLMKDVATKTQQLKNVRQIGAMVAADLICDDPKRRLGFEVYQQATKLGALLRPIANTIYWLPPITTDSETLNLLAEITEKAIIITTQSL